MKTIEKDILAFQENDYFTPLRNKIDYAKLVVLSARNLLLEFEPSSMHINCKMKLVIDKMSRLFFYKSDKCFSISFPFNTYIEDNKITELTTYTGKKVDFQTISAVISILENNEFKLNPSLIDFYIESNGIESIGFSLLEEILQFEPSYLRYDHDPEHEKGKLHPLHHFDINYSTYGTFKLGLKGRVDLMYVENILNLKTECSYIID